MLETIVTIVQLLFQGGGLHGHSWTFGSRVASSLRVAMLQRQVAEIADQFLKSGRHLANVVRVLRALPMHAIHVGCALLRELLVHLGLLLRKGQLLPQ